MSENLRVGIIGTGGLGTQLGQHLTETTGADLIALADVDQPTRNAAGEQLGVGREHRYEEYERMFEEVDLDAVMIATPHTLHYEQVLTAMDHGLHVLCEKPLTTDLDTARDIAERDADRTELLQVGYQRHIEGPYVTARERLHQMEDTPSFVTAEITQNWIKSQRGSWRTNPDLSGGGQLYDTGSHVIDAVLWTTGLTPTAVSASMVFWEEDPRVDIQAALTIEFEEDAVATVAVSGDTPVVREHHHYWGNDGGVFIEGRNWNDRTVRVIGSDSTESHPGTADRYPNKVVGFVESIRKGEPPVATADDAVAVTAVTEAAYESAETGETVDIDL